MAATLKRYDTLQAKERFVRRLGWIRLLVLVMLFHGNSQDWGCVARHEALRRLGIIYP